MGKRQSSSSSSSDPPPSSRRRRTRSNSSDNDDDNNNNTNDAPGEETRNGRRTKTTAPETTTTTTTNTTTNAPFYSSLLSLKLDSKFKQRLPGAAPETPAYTEIPDKAKEARESISEEQFESIVTTSMRIILAKQSTGKKVSGTDLRRASPLCNVNDKKAKEMLPAIRAVCAERFRDVFGYGLIAGDVNGPLNLTEEWRLVNALRSDRVNLALNEASEASFNASRGVMMITLALVMLNDGKLRERFLLDELEKFGVPRDKKSNKSDDPTLMFSAAEFLKQWTSAGYLRKHETGVSITEDASKEIEYEIGPKAVSEIGSRAVLQFIIRSTGVEKTIGETEEREFLGLHGNEENNDDDEE